MPRAGATFRSVGAVRRALLCSAFATTAISSPVFAATYLWTGGNANWDIPINWSPNGEPGAADTANIFNGNQAQISSTGNNASILNVGGSALGGSLLISSGGALNVGTRVLLGQGTGQ